MEQSLESTKVEVQKVDANTFNLTKGSRWMDKDRRLFSIISIYDGRDFSKPYSSGFDRTAVDLLNVHAETIEYIEIGRFMKYVIDRKLMPWKEEKTNF
jgi:hypothetical protein